MERALIEDNMCNKGLLWFLVYYQAEASGAYISGWYLGTWARSAWNLKCVESKEWPCVQRVVETLESII